MNIDPFQPHLKQAYLKLVTILILLSLVGFSVVGQYGVSWEEGSEISTVQYNTEFIRDNRPIPKDFAHHGVWFNGVAELVFQVQLFLSPPINDYSLPSQTLEKGDRDLTPALYQRIQIKHPLTFAVSLLAYFAVGGFVGLLTGWDYAWFAPIVLALFPRFWGYSFYNPKDIPFAALFTLGTFLAALLLNFYRQHPSSTLGCNRLTFYSLGYGVFVGLVSGIRISGLILLFFLILTHLLLNAKPQRLLQTLEHYSLVYGLMIAVWALTTTLIHPASWSNPPLWFLETLQYFAQHTWPGVNLFAGETLKATEIPRHYLPQWLFITIPLLWQITFGLGLIFVLKNYFVFTPQQKIATLLLLEQVLGGLGWTILTKPPLYNGMRQFLFLLPGIAVIAATALIWIYQSLSTRISRFFGMSLLVIFMSAIAFDMITLHPHEYVYFNRASGGLLNAQGQYDTDYGGVSIREAVEWVNANAAPNATLAIGGPQYIGEMFARSDLQVLDLEQELGYGEKGQPDYYVAMPYINLQQLYPQCPIAYGVIRYSVPLSIVRQCI